MDGAKPHLHKGQFATGARVGLREAVLKTFAAFEFFMPTRLAIALFIVSLLSPAAFAQRMFDSTGRSLGRVDAERYYSASGQPIGRVEGERVYDSSGHPLGRIDGNRVYNATGKQIGRIDGDTLYSASGTQLGRIDGDRLYDSSGRQMGRADGLRRMQMLVFFYFFM